MRILISVLLLILLTLTVLQPGCAQQTPSPVQTAQPQTSVSSGNVLQDLYQAAKKEGEVIWQGSTPQTQNQPIFDAFQAKYPGVKVTYQNLLYQDATTRIMMEFPGGNVSIDVAAINPVYLKPLMERNIPVTKYDWTKVSDIDPGNIYYDGAFLGIYDIPFVYIYNTKLVSQNDVPRTADDLLNPKWKNSKIAMTPVDSSVATIYPVWQKDQPKAIDFLNKLQQQSVFVVQRGTDVLAKVSTGEAPLGVCSVIILIPAIQQGQPLAVAPISPTVFTPSGVYVPQKSPHPNAAKLFAAWLSSSDSKDARLAVGQTYAMPANASPAAELIAKTGIQPIRLSSMSDIDGFISFAQKETDILFKPK